MMDILGESMFLNYSFNKSCMTSSKLVASIGWSSLQTSFNRVAVKRLCGCTIPRTIVSLWLMFGCQWEWGNVTQNIFRNKLVISWSSFAYCLNGTSWQQFGHRVAKKKNIQLEQINSDAIQAVQPKAGQVSNQIFYQRSATVWCPQSCQSKLFSKRGWTTKLSGYPLVNEHSWIHTWSVLIANTSSSGPFCIAMSAMFIYQSVVPIQFRSNLVWPFSDWTFYLLDTFAVSEERRTPMMAPFGWEVFAGGISWHSKTILHALGNSDVIG